MSKALPILRLAGLITLYGMKLKGLAVAQFRKALLVQILYAGDDLSGENWDKRGWQSRKEVRGSLFWLATDACLEM